MSHLEYEIDSNQRLRQAFEDLLRERSAFSLPETSLTPREIVKMLELDEMDRRIQNRRARLFFDGKHLKWVEGRNMRFWPATSGKQGHTAPIHQTKKDVGPIPEGKYTALQRDFQRWEDTGIFNRAACLLNIIKIKAGRWPGCTMAWGTRRVGLLPYPGTEVYGRSNFTIHGGWFPGSIGCIDLTNSMEAFAKEFLYYAKDMELEVRY
ncbi:DUF2778 domain-containing protein [Cupriavidus sp. WS]|uniref:DUF2778 domain-containing protein n=1 Tax=Cupriavidus sp. WS TaxID=1312922 RepID=UPI00035F4BEB|nr:DUF2778 domain-containing protein [Cupriavidus sp. WS]